MGELQVIAARCRPEQLIAQFERGETPIIDRVEFALSVSPCDRFKVYLGRREAEQSLARNRQMLASLPSDETVQELAAVARQALGTSTESLVRRQVADLIGSFPTAKLTDPETYMAALIFDLLDAEIPDAVIYFGFQNIRRTSRFLPAIAEAFAACESVRRRWEQVLNFPRQLEATRARLEATTREAEKKLAEEIEHERHRLEREAQWAARQGELPRVKTRYVCAYPSLQREFANDAEALDLITRLDADAQAIASSVLATKGRDAALKIIRKRIEAVA